MSGAARRPRRAAARVVSAGGAFPAWRRVRVDPRREDAAAAGPVAPRERERRRLEGTFHLTRIAVLRCLGVAYAAFFWALLSEARPLLNNGNGLVPLEGSMAALDDGAHAGCALRGEGCGAAFAAHPSLFWVVPPEAWAVEAAAWAGLALAAAVVLGPGMNLAAFGALWFVHLSFANAGSPLLSQGWESMLAEAGVLAAAMCPLLGSAASVPPGSPAPVAVVWLLRLMAFRTVVGAAFVRLQADDCWAALSCYEHSYLTQPLPTTLAWYAHLLPGAVHRAAAATGIAVELVVSLGLLFPFRAARVPAAAAVAVYHTLHSLFALAGAYHHVALVVLLAFLDDAHLAPAFRLLGGGSTVRLVLHEPMRAAEGGWSVDKHVRGAEQRAGAGGDEADADFTSSSESDVEALVEAGASADVVATRARVKEARRRERARARKEAEREAAASRQTWEEAGVRSLPDLVRRHVLAPLRRPSQRARQAMTATRTALRACFVAWVLWHSWRPLDGMVSPPDAALSRGAAAGVRVYARAGHVASLYSPLGPVLRERLVLVFQGSAQQARPADGGDSAEGGWLDYELPCLGGGPDSPPCAPLPPLGPRRLDWLLAVSARDAHEDDPWAAMLAWRLLRGEDWALLSLFSRDPFGGRAPAWVRARIFRYRFSEAAAGGSWWTREEVGTFLPACSLQTPGFSAFLRDRGWVHTRD